MTDALKDRPVMLVAVLGLVCVLAAVGLGLVAGATHERIEAEVEKAGRDALTRVHPDATRFQDRTARVGNDTLVYYEAYDKDGALIGYACEGHATGYSSTIKLTVGLDPELTTITGVRITSQQETPGLGANCVKGGTQKYIWQIFSSSTGASSSSAAASSSSNGAHAAADWQGQFGQRSLDLFVREGKSYYGVDALSGATITTNAVVRAIQDAVETLYRAKGLDLQDAISAAKANMDARETDAN